MDLDTIPKLAPGCRLHPSQDVLLVPEGTLNLAGPAREILAQIDGSRSVAAIVDTLVQQYSSVGREEISADVISLLGRMEQRGVVRS